METTNFIELIPYFGIALFGSLAHIMAKLAKLEKESKWSWKKWKKKNTFATILSVMLSLAGVFLLQSTGALSLVTVFLMGYTGDSMVKNGDSRLRKTPEKEDKND